jgi:hypothetical protein
VRVTKLVVLMILIAKVAGAQVTPTPTPMPLCPGTWYLPLQRS